MAKNPYTARPTYPKVCEDCGLSFDAGNNAARFCSDACRKRTARRVDANNTADGGRYGELVLQVTEELSALGALDTTSGRLAVELARRLSAPGTTGVAGLSREFRQVLAEAKASAPPAPPAEGEQPEAEPAKPVSALERARAARDAKRAAAGSA